ncbi:MAG: helix-turn-helix domain-containing protein [Dehalococcoidia bacterium]
MNDETPWLALGERLGSARRRLFLSQNQVAQRVGITQGAYSQIERGRIRPRLSHLRTLSALLHLSLAELLPLAGYEVDALVTSVAMDLALGS